MKSAIPADGEPVLRRSVRCRMLRHRTRYFILVLGACCLSIVYCNMIAFNFTVICMTNDPANITTTTSSPGAYSDTYYYTQSQKSLLFGAVAVGALLSTFPFNWLYVRFGSRGIYFLAGIASALSTAAIPPAAALGIYWFLTARFMQGVSFGANFATIGLITVQWASMKQNGLFIATLTSFTAFATLFTMPLAGFLCESSYGWPSVYYTLACITVPLFVLWLCFFRDDPQLHPTVSDVELERIHRNKSDAHRNSELKVPYRAVFSNPTVWSCWFCALADLLTVQLIGLYGPTYLNRVLGYGVKSTGLIVALPVIAYTAVRMISGFASDWIKGFIHVYLFNLSVYISHIFRCVSERTKMLFFNTFALGACAVLLIAMSYTDRSTAWMAVWFLTALKTSFGPAVGGFYKCTALVTRQYNHFVLANIQFIKCLALFIEPFFMWLFVSEANTPAEWRIIFFIHAGLLLASCALFFFFADDKPAAFALDSGIASGRPTSDEEENCRTALREKEKL